MQRFGSAVNLNVHLHMLVPDGCYTFEHDRAHFHRAPAPSPAQLQITRDSRFLYAPNRGHDSVAVFKVDALNGGLTPTGHHATEKVPRAFSIDDSGRYVFVAGLETARLATYRIDQETGALQPLSSRRVGNLPMWVLVAA